MANDGLINRVQRVVGLIEEGAVGDQVRPNRILPNQETASRKARRIIPGTGVDLAQQASESPFRLLEEMVEQYRYFIHLYRIYPIYTR